MRYFLIIFALCAIAIAGIAGKRGGISRNPPLEVFPDMDRQLKLRPQEPNAFFANGISSQMPVPGTIARTEPIQTPAGPVYPFEDAPVFTGRVTGTTNFVEHNPMTINAQLLQRGRERYTIFCSPCHGSVGDGQGITQKIRAMGVVANLHDKRIVQLNDGELFYVVTHGRNLMGAYGSQVPVEDRWAVIAYVRALQRSRLGTIDDVPQDQRGGLN